MTLTVFILTVPSFLCGTTIGGFALVVSGIRKGDRAVRFADKPSTHAEAIARRVLGVGIRAAGEDQDERAEI